MVKKARKTSRKSEWNKETAVLPADRDQLLREHLLYLLKGGGAHISFNDAMGDWPLHLTGTKPGS